MIIIGAGAGGLAAAIRLARAGKRVTLADRFARPGGKMRQVEVGGQLISNGPTVCTMRWVVDLLLREGGLDPEAELQMTRAPRLARHGWLDGTRLDLFAEAEASAAAIAEAFGSREADSFLRFARAAAETHDILKESFMTAPKTGPIGLMGRIGWHRPQAILATSPFLSLAADLRRYFRDPRLIQLFARYATYVGSSPYLAPATLKVIAHVEQDGVWLVEGGMPALAAALLKGAEQQGAVFRPQSEVSEILVDGGEARGVRFASGETLIGGAVVFNGDPQAIASGLLGTEVSGAVPALPAARRSLAAVTLCAVGQTSGFPLDYHTVLFGDDYPDEFNAIFRRREIRDSPTIYICAEDRRAGNPEGAERLFCLVNAPATGDVAGADLAHPGFAEWVCQQLARHGLFVRMDTKTAKVTTPADFHAAFPATGGALYGAANHGPFDSFRRPGARSRLKGLYLAGGGCHPGAGVPMAMISGMLAADAVLQDTEVLAAAR
ncbi:phytoene desaturase family protein [Hyphomonas sp.]|uniref:phytoene desaturase family protein n=1 Tax=Hyphomonas sp. TaxID=87 RepID=UPI00391A8DD2